MRPSAVPEHQVGCWGPNIKTFTNYITQAKSKTLNIEACQVTVHQEEPQPNTAQREREKIFKDTYTHRKLNEKIGKERKRIQKIKVVTV